MLGFIAGAYKHTLRVGFNVSSTFDELIDSPGLHIAADQRTPKFMYRLQLYAVTPDPYLSVQDYMIDDNGCIKIWLARHGGASILCR